MSLDLSGNSLTSTAFSGLTYFPGGELKTASLGIDPTSKVPAVSLVRSFDNRSRITGEVDQSSAKQNLYSYSVGYDGFGNVTSYNDSVAGSWTVKNDALHRFSSSTGTYSGKASSFQATYDHFGNRNVEYFTYNGVQNQPSQYLNFPTGNNRAATYMYDNAGNLFSDGTNNYLYDAENRICAVDQLSSGSLIGYVYSPDGTRFGKGTITKTFSCDVTKNGMLTANGLALTTGYNVAPDGDLLEETDGNFNLRHFNVFLQGKLLGTFAGTTYSQANWAIALNDWLGTKRQIVKSGADTTSYFSGPFGDYLTQGGTGSDPSDQHFTGKERDIESGLDYFPARYYSSNLGRFMSPDWSAMGDDLDPVPYADLNNPQSLNLYSYVQNNPLSHKDADGHKCDGGSVGPDGTFTFHCTNDPPQNPNGTMYQLAGALGLGFAPETGGASLGIAAGFAGAMLAAEYLAAHPIHLSSSNEPAPTTPGTAPSAPVPSGLVGTQDGKSGQAGGRHNSGPLDPAHGGSGDAARDFNTLTGGKAGPAPAGSNYPPGTQVGDNGISLRPARGNSGPRIDIPANGDKPHETLHYPN